MFKLKVSSCFKFFTDQRICICRWCWSRLVLVAGHSNNSAAIKKGHSDISHFSTCYPRLLFSLLLKSPGNEPFVQLNKLPRHTNAICIQWLITITKCPQPGSSCSSDNTTLVPAGMLTHHQIICSESQGNN